MITQLWEKKNCRVAFITGVLDLGGSTTFLLNISSGLIKEHLKVKIFSLSNHNPLASDFQLNAIPVTAEDNKHRIFEDVVKSSLLKLNAFAPSIVVACLAPSSFEILRYLPADILKIGVIQSDDQNVYKMVQLYEKYIDCMVGVSQKIVESIRNIPAFEGKPVFYIPYGIKIPSISTNLISLDHSQPLKILYLGRVCKEQKRVHLFPKILNDLKNMNLNFIWTIAGDGDELNYLKKEMISASPGQLVKFVGQVPYRNTPDIIKDNDVFLLTSDYEGLPLSLIEAMAYGLVPVVSDLPSGIREAVDSNCGILVDVNNTSGYSKALYYLWKNPAVLRNMSEASAKKAASSFSVELMVSKWIELFNMKCQKGGSLYWSLPSRVSSPLTCEGRFQFSKLGKIIRRIKKYINFY